MKTETPWLRWTMTKAEAEVLTDAADMVVGLNPDLKPDAQRELKSVRATLTHLIRKSNLSMVTVELSLVVANEIKVGVVLLGDWMGHAETDPNAYTDPQKDALVGLVAEFKSEAK